MTKPDAERGVLRCRGVDVVRGARTIIAEANLVARPGRVLVLVGPNGAGKSSLLNVLSGLLPPAAGSVTLDDVALGAWPTRDLARRRAMLSQRVQLTFGFSVEEVVSLGRSPHTPNEARDRAIVDAALRAAHAWAFRGRNFLELSGGEQQRVQLARVLAQIWDAADEGAWLMLDEPEAGLDIAHQHFILRRARELAAAGFGVIAVLHDLNLAARYADDIAVIACGRILRQGTPETALDPPMLSEVYGISLERRAHDPTGWTIVPS
ncbi:iron complex transport system ATP-binding protein [Luteibacter rhizovicinus]|uniref:Iron complex transport system ATP-binding protein n=1 Tax=Luteibacter rhizovicinus TaxID=242606 RepID=A0A4R3YXK2_9GAMM|nr:heme ABC transporter ATP-binding protein [Luteibacter rhizovicinus]TCV96194.1 iron complex transport system ATP-binding protein [Luteibacter rhizovicinus]